jgi:tetrapyrrole methylase family protein/MazG family protein
MQDVVDDIVQKLIHRHPHVYGTVEVDNAEQVLVNWEKIKAKEKTERKRVLDGVTKGQPALMRAYKLQKKTAKVGFDWDNTADVKAKVREEINELAEAVAEDNKENMEWELGDVLFALTNYARHLGLEPEVALNKANNRFEKRFAFVEDAVKATGRSWATFDLKDLDKLWNDAKKQEKILKKGD